jgi:hypothetical protein
MKAQRTTKLALLAGVVLLAGCGQHSDPPIWSAQAASPDGKLIALAQTMQTGGFGTADAWTTVTLRQPWEKHSIVILSFDDNSIPSLPVGDTAVGLHWLSNSHLCVTYGKNVGVLFQAIKALGISISVEQLVPSQSAKSCSMSRSANAT